MATISSTLSLRDNMSSTLSSITRAMRSTLTVMRDVQNANLGGTYARAAADIELAERAVNNFNNQLDDSNNLLTRGTSSSNSFLKSLLGFSAISKVLNLVTGQLDSAVSRMDTMNNYPKVMSNLGISNDQAEASIQVLSKGLEGIPTTLNDAALAVQKFTSVNNNVGYSTELFLALNNAILAGGASTAIQSSALEQLSQSYSKGKMDMLEWRTLQMAMPGQLQQIAKAMNMSTNELGEGLRYGTVNMNDFTDTIIKLNKEGIDGFQNFADQAKNATGGLSTSIANMKSAVTRGVVDVIEGLNSGLEKAGLGNIQSIITNSGKAIENVLSGIGNFLAQLSPAFTLMKNIGSFVINNWSLIAPILVLIAAAVIAYNTALTINNTLQGISNGLKTIGIINTIAHGGAITAEMTATTGMTAAQLAFNASLLACPLTWIVAGIMILIAAIYLVTAAVNQATGTTYSGTGIVIGILNTLWAVVQNIFIAIYNLVVTVANGIVVAFNNPLQTIALKFLATGEMILNIINSIAQAIDNVFGSNLSSATQGLLDNLYQAQSNVLATVDYSGTVDKMDYKNLEDAYYSGYGFGATLKNQFGMGSLAGDSATDILNSLDSSLNNLIGTDGSGGSALKTTTDDDLLSDEDIQMLLDIATRDYQLSYQAITPNISVQFGDVRETADVDGVMDVIAGRIDEIINGDAEVID